MEECVYEMHDGDHHVQNAIDAVSDEVRTFVVDGHV